MKSLAITPDRRFVFSGGDDNAFVKFDFTTGAAVKKITDVHEWQVWRMVVAPNVEFLVSEDDAVLKVLNTETLELIKNLDLGNNRVSDAEDDLSVYSLAVAPDSMTIAVGDDVGETQLWKKGREGGSCG